VSALITIIHVIICLILIVAVLLQSGKAADLAGAFGGGGSATAFGPRGNANVLSKVTEICAILFMFTSLALWVLSGRESKSAVSGVKAPAAATQTAPQPNTTQPAPQTQKPAVSGDVKKDEKAAADKAQPQNKAAAPQPKPSTATPDKQPAAKK
jgi:preprotein translocase subunit SecG